MKRSYSLFLAFMLSIVMMAQQRADVSKLSSHLAERWRTHCTPPASRAVPHQDTARVLALVKLADAPSATVFEEHACRVEAQIGSIYVVHIPFSSLGALSLDARVVRIEAERMPRPAMDTSAQHIHATGIYHGAQLPQAFTGKGVVAGVFDCFYDFTHPAFYDSEGNTRIKYYYDFCWPNADGTRGHAIDRAADIVALQHSQHALNGNHGTHVAGIMAGSAVEGKYQGMAPESDIYLADFNSDRADFENPDEHTSATAVLGFKYLFDRAAAEQKPCVVNFSSCESITLSRQRILEGEALRELVGPGRIIVAAAGNMGHQIPYMEKKADMQQAGAAITNGLGGGGLIDMDIVTPANQHVRIDFWGIKLVEPTIEGSVSFHTDSIKALQGDTCVLHTTVSMGDVEVKVVKSAYTDPRGDVYHISGTLPNIGYLMFCGASFLLTGDAPAWLYSDLFYSPFANIEGVPEYNVLQQGYSVSWPATLPFVVAVGATGYKNTFTNVDGTVNRDMDMFLPDAVGKITKFSSLGPTFDGLIKPDVVAPGLNINAAYNSFSSTAEADRKTLTDRVTYNGKDYYYMAQSGTSMASPMVAGVVALWLEANPQLSPQDVLDIIAQCSQKPEPQWDYPNNTYGHGQIDAYKGLLLALSLKTSIPTLDEHQPPHARFKVESGILHVLWDQPACETIRPGNVTLTIYNLNGRCVLQTQGLTANLSHLPSGVYAVQMHTGAAQTSGSTLIRL